MSLIKPLVSNLQKILKIKDAVNKITLRTSKLLFWGILLQGGYSHSLADNIDLVYGVGKELIRWCGILQRIVLVYLVVALIETLTTKWRPLVIAPGHLSSFSAYRWRWIRGFTAFAIYMITTYSLYVPDWSFIDHEGGTIYTVKCGMRGHLGPACNAVGYMDREILGINHLYKSPVRQRLKFNLSYSLGHHRHPLRACADTFQGPLSKAQTTGINGTWLTFSRLTHERIFPHCFAAIPINKQLYTISYVCLTAGAAGVVFSGVYILIHVWGLRTPFLFLEWIGMNSMLILCWGHKVYLQHSSVAGTITALTTHLSLGSKLMFS
ncbi:hypothetical protein QQP08_018214 [Theobroma cacao]|nr:hypothetical protein QQP08_018214 [Theobroma cacao]